MEKNKVAIIGLGPAGIAAAIYLKRYGMNPVCFERDLVGGKTNYTESIENYPGYLEFKGPTLSSRFEEQLKHFGIKPIYKEVKKLEKVDDHFLLSYGKEQKEFKYVIIANGLKEKELAIEGEETFNRRGISRCAICDGPFYAGKKVAVIGAGNSAFEEALYLSTICEQVYIIARRNKYRAMEDIVRQAKESKNIKIYSPYITVSCTGENTLEHLIIENNETKERETLDISGLFIYIGEEPVLNYIDFDINKTANGFIITDERMETSVKNLYAIGDCRNTLLRQVATAVSDGTVAATSIHKDYLEENDG